jgi:hypothetical protein
MTRNLKTLVSAAALTLIGTAALAQNVPPTWANEQIKPFTSTVTRAQVLAEVQAARQAGTLNAYDEMAYSQPKADHGSLVTVLAQVRQGADRAAATATASQPEGALSREQVRAELEAARRSGELNPFDSEGYARQASAKVYAAPAALAQSK